MSGQSYRNIKQMIDLITQLTSHASKAEVNSNP